MRAKALVVFPGGYGTLDELFETLTLIQTKKIKPFPVLIFGRTFWERVIRFEALVEEGTVAPEDIELFRYVETAEEAWKIIRETYQVAYTGGVDVRPLTPKPLPSKGGSGRRGIGD
jgi:predicted Rossmann-fold nucleotide-binding protein